MNAQTEVIYNQDGETTDLAVPDDFGNGLAFLNPSDMPDLDTAEVGINITPESIEFKNAGESIRAVFNGFTFLKVKDKVNKGAYTEKQAAVLQTKTGIKINMGANLLKQLALIPVGTAIQITYKGLEVTSSGNDVKVYDVNLLNVPRVNIHSVPQVQRRVPALPKNTSDNYDENAPIEIVDTLHFWAVTEAAKYWNIEAGDAAKQIAKAALGKMDKREFLDWLKNPPAEQPALV